MNGKRWALAAVMFALVSASCSDDESSKPSTAIVVEVYSDLDVPAKLDEIRVSASSGVDETDAGNQTTSGSLESGGVELPVRAVLLPAPGVTTVRVLAEGYLNGVSVRSQARRTEFVENEVVTLRMELAEACDIDCPDGQTCVATRGTARCVSEVVDLHEPDGGNDGGEDGHGDGGLDGGGDAGDAGKPAPCVPEKETCNDDDDDCDGDIDEGSTICRQDMPFGVVACLSDGEGGKACRLKECEPAHLDCEGDGPGCGTPVTADNCGCGVECSGDDPCQPTLIDPSEYACVPGGCEAAGTTLCNDNFCANTETNTVHCGECNHACPQLANAMATCEDGECKLVCQPGYESCDGYDPGTPGFDNGCETNTDRDVEHCGSCDGANHVCPVRDHSAPVCDDGICDILCDDGFLDCDMMRATGCEEPVSRDNCYQCGNECSDGVAGILLPEMCCAGPRDCCTL